MLLSTTSNGLRDVSPLVAMIHNTLIVCCYFKTDTYTNQEKINFIHSFILFVQLSQKSNEQRP